MTTTDTCVSVSPYFQIHPGQAAAFRAVCEKYVAWSGREPGCLYYGFSFDGDLAHCREGFVDADALLAHLENLRPILHEMGEVSQLIRIEVHGPAQALTMLKEPLARLNPQWFELEFGYRKLSVLRVGIMPTLLDWLDCILNAMCLSTDRGSRCLPKWCCF